MFHRLCGIALAAATLLATTACTDSRDTQRAAAQASEAAQRVAMASRMQEADAVRQLAGQTLAMQTQRVEALSAELAELQAAKAARERSLQAYMLEHKMAVAALAAGVAGGLAALDDSGSVSQEAREMGALVGMVAIGWAVFNMDEVVQVADNLMQAEAALRALAARADGVARRLAQEQSNLEQAQARYDSAVQHAAGVRAALQTM